MCKKLVLLLIVLSLLVFFLPNIGLLHRNIRNEKVGIMNRQEFFRNLSYRYYGTDEFADELELVNRALEINSPGQIKNTDLIIPDPESISRLSAKRTMQIKMKKNQLLAQNQQHQSIMPTLVLLFQLHLIINQMILPVIVLIAILILIIRFIRDFRRRNLLKFRKSSKDKRNSCSGDRILIEFDVTKLDKE